MPRTAFVIKRVEELATINEQTDEYLTLEDQYQNIITNEYTTNIIGGYVNTGVEYEGNADTID